MATIKIKNNFDTYKADFKKNTGLDWDKNMEQYIAYYNARSADVSAQMSLYNHEVLNNLPNVLSVMLKTD